MEKWIVVTCAPVIFGEKTPERPYIKHNDMDTLKFHLVTTYKAIEPPVCMCGDEIPAEVIRQFNVRVATYPGIEPLPVPEKKGLIV